MALTTKLAPVQPACCVTAITWASAPASYQTAPSATKDAGDGPASGCAAPPSVLALLGRSLLIWAATQPKSGRESESCERHCGSRAIGDRATSCGRCQAAVFPVAFTLAPEPAWQSGVLYAGGMAPAVAPGTDERSIACTDNLHAQPQASHLTTGAHSAPRTTHPLCN
jgi:hypothetical protein